MRQNSTNEPRTTSRLRIFLIVIGVIIVSAAGYLETITIPALLADEVGSIAIYLHLGSILVLVGTASYLASNTIFKVFDRLVTAHLNNLFGTIGNLATGKWSSDAQVQQNVFSTGAKMGFNIRDEVIEPDRNQIVDGINGMSLPATRQAAGVDTSVIDEMNNYQDDLQARKNRLS